MSGGSVGGGGVRGGSADKGAGFGIDLTTGEPLVKPSRGVTSKNVLSLDWDFAVVGSIEADAVARESGRTYAKSKREALERHDAFAQVAGDDPRPLLVLRECGFCEGSDDAVLSSRFENEKTILLSRWFHTVKLPNHVLESNHEFRNLFEGEAPPHLFLCTKDGQGVIGLNGQQSQSELWDAMDEVLGQVYSGDSDRTIKQVIKLLDQFDQLDEEENRLLVKLDEEIESKGASSSKYKKLKKELDKALVRRDEIRVELDELLKTPITELGAA